MASKRRNIHDVRMELSGINFRLLSMAIMHARFELTPEQQAEVVELEKRRAELNAEYPKADQSKQWLYKDKK